MKILFTADQHITLRKSKVPKDWALNRYRKLFDKLTNIKCDLIVLGGDWFDKTPNLAELSLFIEFLQRVQTPVHMIAGNHEASTKYNTFLRLLQPLESPNFKLKLHNPSYVEYNDVIIHYFTYHYIKANIEPPKPIKGKKNILVTHARGKIQFADAEYDFNRFKDFDLVLVGDLHYYHQHLPFKNVWYPGSPYTIQFSKTALEDTHGIFVVDTKSKNWEIPKFIGLDLPQLVKITIDPTLAKYNTPKDSHCYLPIVEGNIDELTHFRDDKTVVKKLKVSNTSTLDLLGKSKLEELSIILDYMKVKDKKSIMDLYNEVV